MHISPALALGMMLSVACHTTAAPVPVTLRQGQPYVRASGLETQAGIVLKTLPGSSRHVACSTERCAQVPVLQDADGAPLVSVKELADALGLQSDFDSDLHTVTFSSSPDRSNTRLGVAQVGGLAPALRLTRLDGSPVSLESFRGQRVLINSWASW